jgi:hypothetical protein
VTRLDTQASELRDRALTLAGELGLDQASWYLRMLQLSQDEQEPADLGALVRAYWELQQVTGRSDLRDEWRRLADALWQGDAA